MRWQKKDGNTTMTREDEMNITKDTKLKDLLEKYPWLVDEAIKISSKFKVLNSPVGKMMVRKATIADMSAKSGLGTDEIIDKITELIKAHK